MTVYSCRKFQSDHVVISAMFCCTHVSNLDFSKYIGTFSHFSSVTVHLFHLLIGTHK